MSTPAFKVGDKVWHCDAHGGPSRPNDMQEDRWLPAMRPCEITSVEGPDKWGSYTYGIRHTDGREGELVVNDSWLAKDYGECPPYFRRKQGWPALGEATLIEFAATGVFVAFRKDDSGTTYAFHASASPVPDAEERTFHARRFSFYDLTQKLADITKARGVHSLDADDFARIVRGAVAAGSAPDWVLNWCGVLAEDAAHFAPKATATPGTGSTVAEQVKVAAKAHKATRGTKKEKLTAAAEAVNATEATPEPVETPAAEHIGESTEMVPAAPAPVYPTHFRGVLLRPASEWSDPAAEGVFVGVTNADYHADKLVVGGSGLGDYLKSAAHAKIEKSIPPRSRDIGTLVHGDVLEGKDAAALGFAVVEGKTTTKTNTVTDDMVRIAKACAAALREDEHTAKVATLPGLRELSCRVRCPESGLMLKCRFDLAPDAGGWAWDIKTTSSEDPGEFAVSFGNFGYSLQAAHYLRVSALVGLPFRAMAFACVSTEAPFEVWLVKFGPVAGCEELHELATRAAVEACKIEANSRAEGRWEKRKHAPIVAELKSWHLTALRQLANGEGVPH